MNPNPHELAAFLSAIGRPYPTNREDYHSAITAWRKAEQQIKGMAAYIDEETHLRLTQMTRIPFDRVIRDMSCLPETARDYLESLRDIIAEEFPTLTSGTADEIWRDRKRRGFYSVEAEMMMHERKRRLSEKGAVAARKKSMQKN